MAAYNLTIQLSNEDVHTINAAQQKIVIVKQVGGSSGSPVAWVTFSPFENNLVSWEEKYGVYASTTQVQAGATIQKTSAVNPAKPELFYPFETGSFGFPTGNAGRNNYGVENEYSQQFTFGMAQSVTANGSKYDAAPLNAVPVLSNEQATFTPIEIVSVFLHAQFNNGVIISNITSKALDVDLTSEPSVTIHYSSSQGEFIMGALAVTT